jgi:two-component system cell cycle response regulator CtrA
MTHCTACEERDEKIKQLERELYGREWEAPKELRLTKLEAAIVATMLANNRVCSPALLIDATRGRGTHTNNPNSNLIDAKICHIRAKLRPYGLRVETVWGTGYKIEDETRAQLLNWTTRRAA